MHKGVDAALTASLLLHSGQLEYLLINTNTSWLDEITFVLFDCAQNNNGKNFIDLRS